MIKIVGSVITFTEWVLITFLTFVTRTIVENYYPGLALDSSSDLNVGLVLLLDFAYFLTVFLFWWAIFFSLKKLKEKQSVTRKVQNLD